VIRAIIKGSEGAPIAQAAGGPTEWFGHPRGLTILFLTDMWEQFSYYGMRAILVYYMTKQLLLGQERASLIYGIYTACFYFTPIVGGVISDRWLGRRNSVVIGGSIMAVGHFMMAFEPAFYVALAAIAIGNGLFLPSLPSQIKDLYHADDPRQKGAYNIFYVGVNLGGLLAPLACGTVGEIYGWHWGFTIAGVGMIIGLLVYLMGGRYLPPESARGLPRPTSDETPLPVKGLPDRHATLSRGATLFCVAAGAIVFRTAYEQVGNSVAIWTETVDRSVGHFVIPMTWFQALNPLLVMLITPWLVSHWLRLARIGREPSSITKMSIGAAIVALSYLFLAGVAFWAETHGVRTGSLWLASFFVVMTTGELYILPVGLGLFGRLAPAGLNATTIAFWLLAVFAGSLAAGVLGTLWSQRSPTAFFLLTAAVAALSAALLFLLSRISLRDKAV
jgi:POT family proton-dependent oligopeptide transporter